MEAYLGEKVARAVHHLGLPRETVRTIDKPDQLHHALYSIEVPQVLCLGRGRGRANDNERTDPDEYWVRWQYNSVDQIALSVLQLEEHTCTKQTGGRTTAVGWEGS